MPYPHPCVSENLLLSFSMNSTSVRSPGTVSGVLAEKGRSVNFFGLHSIFAILEPSGKGLPLPGTPSLYALIITGFARMMGIPTKEITYSDPKSIKIGVREAGLLHIDRLIDMSQR